MKSRQHTINLIRFQIKAKESRIQSLLQMSRDFQHIIENLENEIQSEEERCKISDPNHFAYPTLAKSARIRLENILTSLEKLDKEKDEEQKSLMEIKEDLQAIESRASSIKHNKNVIAENISY